MCKGQNTVPGTWQNSNDIIISCRSSRLYSVGRGPLFPVAPAFAMASAHCSLISRRRLLPGNVVGIRFLLKFWTEAYGEGRRSA